jgi:crotonobetainyl-CoA:carnitine CoA-transferase CaiB-like acyl-CoA transferase
MSSSALSGVRVLDLSRLLPGPYCSMMLADLGAEVIKIEEPGKGDYARNFPPKVNRESVYYLPVNRNKKSLTLNLKTNTGKDIFLNLVKKSDVVLESFRPGVMHRLGIGYEILSNVNSKIILCSISGYGQDGPYAKKAGHDVNYLSIAGILGVNGTKDGKPIIPGVQFADIGGGGLLSAFCIVSALFAREKNAVGQHIDVSMMDGVFSWLCTHAGKYYFDRMLPQPSNEMLSGQFACYNVYKTKDNKYLSLGALEPQFWSAFCRAIGRVDFIERQFERGEKAKKTIEHVSEILLTRSRDEWMKLLENVDCCCEPVNNFEEAFNHPQIKHRNMFVEMDHPTEGIICQINFPAKFSKTPAEIRTPPPSLGQNTEEILGDLGICKKEIDLLKRKKII